jgi:hypothetical protein
MKRMHTAIASAFAALLAGMPAHAQNPYLEAPVIRENIRLEWNSTDKVFEWTADNGTTPRDLDKDSLFLARTSLRLLYPRLNPLKLQVSATVTAADDPSAVIIGKLVDALTSVGSLVAPGSSATASAAPGGAAADFLRQQVAPPLPMACAAPGSAQANVGGLNAALYAESSDSKTIVKDLSDWAKLVDDDFGKGMSGDAAVRDAADKITDVAKGIQTSVDLANKILDAIVKCDASSLPSGSADATLYLAAQLNAAGVRARIVTLSSIRETLTQLTKALNTPFGVPDNWTGGQRQAYKLGPQVSPTLTKMQTVTLKVASLTPADDGSGGITTGQKDVASTSMTVRRYSLLTPEIGVGAVFGTIRAPQYGTATNSAGQTVVARVPNSSLTVSPAIMVNFLCRCGTGFLDPMIQIGAATSKTLPAVLTGIGFHLFGIGKGDVAIGGGAMFGWTKDLQKLKIGDIVTGTKDIDADLGYSGTPHVKAYFTIQYKFN